MSRKNNFFITDNGCCCCHCCKKRQQCCQACWFKDFFCEDDWNDECVCPPLPPCPKPEPPKPKPGKDCNCQAIAIQVVLKNSEAPIIEVGENLKFDTVLHRVGDSITYDETTGEFTIKKAGDYRISWQVIVGGSDTTRFVNFGVKLNGEAYHDFPLPVTAGLLTSDLILTTKKPNEVVAFYNNTADKVRLSRHLPNANLVITTI